MLSKVQQLLAQLLPHLRPLRRLRGIHPVQHAREQRMLLLPGQGIRASKRESSSRKVLRPESVEVEELLL